MSTSSTYSSNKLKQVLNNKTQHFIIKSYITSSFEYDRKKDEYHLYWYNRNSGVDIEFLRYKNMSNKKMNKKELKLFFSTISQYKESINDENGCVWEHIELGFDKSLVKLEPTLFDDFKDFTIFVNPS